MNKTKYRALRVRARTLLAKVQKKESKKSFLKSIYVKLSDGRIGHPASGKWVKEKDIPEGAKIWDSLHEFTKLKDSKGNPSKAASYQREFLEKKAELSIFFGGVGTGKTIVGAFRCTEMALLNPGGLTIIGAAASKLLALNVIPKVESNVPRWAIRVPTHAHLDYKYFKLNRHGYFEMNWKNGHKTIALTLDVKTGAHMRIQGPDACALWLDEASIIPEVVYKVFMERLRDESGMMTQAFFTTSPDEPGWIEKVFFKEGADRSKLAVVRATTEEATFRSKDYCKRLESLYTVDEYRRKVLGIILHYEGLVYEDHLGVAETDSCWLEDFVPDSDLPITIGIDLGYRRCAFVVGQELIKDDRLIDVIFDEGQLSDVTAAELGQFIAKKYKGWNIDVVYTDYSSTSEPDRRELRHRLQGTQVKKAISKENSRYYKVVQGVNLVRHQCRNHRGLRNLFIDASLHGNVARGKDAYPLHAALSLYKEPPDKVRYHTLDALRYYILGKFGPVGTVTIGARV